MKSKYKRLIKDPKNITIAEFVKESGEAVQYVREALKFNEAEVLVDGRGSVASVYRRDDIWKSVEAYKKHLKDNNLTRAAYLRGEKGKRKNNNWTGFDIGTRLRITNAAGRQWVGIFDRYNEVFGYIKLKKGEMLFAPDAILEEVDESVEISADDGIEEVYDNRIPDAYDGISRKED